MKNIFLINIFSSGKKYFCHQEPRWFFSHWDNVCKPYNYSGCGANMNTFLSRAECEVRSVVPPGIVMLRPVVVSP